MRFEAKLIQFLVETWMFFPQKVLGAMWGRQGTVWLPALVKQGDESSWTRNLRFSYQQCKGQAWFCFSAARTEQCLFSLQSCPSTSFPCKFCSQFNSFASLLLVGEAETQAECEIGLIPQNSAAFAFGIECWALLNGGGTWSHLTLNKTGTFWAL